LFWTRPSFSYSSAYCACICETLQSDGGSYNPVSNDDFPHDEASHDALYSYSENASATSIPSNPNSRRSSVMQLTKIPDDPEVGRHFELGGKKDE
jgi:hypothetical protein